MKYELSEFETEFQSIIKNTHSLVYPKTKEVKKDNINKILKMSSTIEPEKLLEVAQYMAMDLTLILKYKQLEEFFYKGLKETGYTTSKQLHKNNGFAIIESVSRGSITISGIYITPDKFKLLSKLYFKNFINIKTLKEKEKISELKRIEDNKKAEKERKKLEKERKLNASKNLEKFITELEEKKISEELYSFTITKFFNKSIKYILNENNIDNLIIKKEMIFKECLKQQNNLKKYIKEKELSIINKEILNNNKKIIDDIINKIIDNIFEKNINSLNKFIKKPALKKSLKKNINNLLENKIKNKIKTYNDKELTKELKDDFRLFSEKNIKSLENDINDITFKYLSNNINNLLSLFKKRNKILDIKKYIMKDKYENFINKKNNIENVINKEIYKLKNKKKFISEKENFDNSKINKAMEEWIELSKEINLIKLSTNNELKAKATITNIEDFYYKARMLKREIKAYVGPTNSGKTHAALKEFKEAKTGIYLAPLRLLAREIYDDLKDELNISLITGEEKDIKNGDTHVSSTIEMLDINREYEVAIIDEVQMIDDIQRGSAWSKAILGVNAKKIILIGSDDSLTIIKKIVEKCDDDLTIKNFDRLTPLKKETKHLNYSDIKSGDAVICFSRRDIYRFKNIIENLGLNVAIVYGALPPETRINQVNLFNSKEADVIISTDAIGMGLNLNIKRVVFSTITKYNGYSNEILNTSLFKQISGRAGRYNKHENGVFAFLKDTNNYYYDSYEKNIFNELANEINYKNKEIKKGFYFPELEHLEKFANIRNFENKLSDIINSYDDYYIDKSNTFELIDFDNFYSNSKIIDENFNKMDLKDKYKYSFAPVSNNSDIFETFIINLKNINNQINKEVNQKDLNNNENNHNLKLPQQIETTMKNYRNYDLNMLEKANKDFMLYIWLLYRYDENDENIKKLRKTRDEISSKITEYIIKNSLSNLKKKHKANKRINDKINNKINDKINNTNEKGLIL